MTNRVREPIQVYLSEEERARLDEAARALGVSRSEVLRRGLEAVGTAAPSAGPLRDLIDAGVVSPARVRMGGPPPRAPGLPFDELMRGLESDRGDR